MYALFAFGLILLVAALMSGAAHRTPLSIAVLFLGGGFAIGRGALDIAGFLPNGPLVATFAELALVSVLYTDGMRIDAHELLAARRLPGRALLLGMPLTMLIAAVLGHLVTGLDWTEALLVGAVLSPTDPVFASALVSRPQIPLRLRRLLNIESGLNDGLALPIVLFMLTMLQGDQIEPLRWLGEVVSGVVIGVGVAWIAVRLSRVRFLTASNEYKPLLALAIVLLVYTLARLTSRLLPDIRLQIVRQISQMKPGRPVQRPRAQASRMGQIRR